MMDAVRNRDHDEFLHSASGASADCCDPSVLTWVLATCCDRDGAMRRTNRTEPTKESRMFIAMNRFRVKKGSEAEFEAVWLNREVHIAKENGFVEFHLLRGPELEDHTLYASHTIWTSEDDFIAWTRSQAFRDAHKDAGGSTPLYLGGPAFEGFNVLQTVKP